MLELRLQYFGHLMWRADSLEKTLMLGKTEGKGRGGRRWGGQTASLTGRTGIWAKPGRRRRTAEPGAPRSTVWQRVRRSLATEQQVSNRTKIVIGRLTNKDWEGYTVYGPCQKMNEQCLKLKIHKCKLCIYIYIFNTFY